MRYTMYLALLLGGGSTLWARSLCDTLHLPLTADSVLAPLVASVDSDSVRAVIQRLQDFGTRYYTTDSLQAARAWIFSEFQRRGADTVFEQPFTYSGYPQANLIARKEGLCPDSLRIVIGAHYDAITYIAPADSAPGADDNGSGVALLLELLRVLQNVPLKRTVEFVAFAAEEPGLVGSGHYAQQASSAGDTFFFYLNADMIGGDADYVNDTIIVEVDQGNQQSGNDAPSQALGDSLAQAFVLYTPLGVEFGPIYASDYMPLEAEGYVTFGVFEYHWNSTYHSPNDVIDSMDVGYATEVIRGVVALVVAMAGVDVGTPVAERSGSLRPRLLLTSRTIVFPSPATVTLLDLAGRRWDQPRRVRKFTFPPRLPRGWYLLRYRYAGGKTGTLRLFVP